MLTIMRVWCFLKWFFFNDLSNSCNIAFDSGIITELLFPRSITFPVLREGHEVVLPHGLSGVARTHPWVTVIQVVLLPLTPTAIFQCIEEVSGGKSYKFIVKKIHYMQKYLWYHIYYSIVCLRILLSLELFNFKE